MGNLRKPVSFIATDNPDKALAFFSTVLELELVEHSAFALVFADGDHMLRIQIVSDVHPPSYTVHGWQVENIKDEMQRLASNGVRFTRFDQLPQDDFGVWTSPDGHKIAWFNDPSGNVLSLTQHADT